MLPVLETDAFQSNLIQCSTTFAKDTFFLIANLNLPECNAKVLSLVRSAVLTKSNSLQ